MTATDGRSAPWLTVGFRLFFLLGVADAVIAMATWVAVLRGAARLPLAGLPPTSWHAHELLFGFVQAIIAGFLLTAVRSWTGRPTLAGPGLVALAAPWVAARGLWSLGSSPAPAAIADLTFGLALLVVLARPIVQARQARQAGVLAKVALLQVAQLVFLAGALGQVADGLRIGVYAALYLIIGLVLTIARRVFVFFVRSALPDAPQLPERPWLDRAALAAFLVLFVLDVLAPWPAGARGAAALLAALHAVRLRSWWAPGVASRSLLWVLFVAYGWFVLGFAAYAAGPWLGLTPALVAHLWAAGGLGTVILGMVARVTLGHTGRDVRADRPGLAAVFAAGIAAALLRVAGPWLAPGASLAWWSAAGAAWVGAFGALLVWGAPMWLGRRADGG